MGRVDLTRADIEPLLEGLAILGTGGGGSPDWGRLIMEDDLHAGRQWEVVSLDSVPDDWTVVCGAAIGSVKAIESIGFAKVLESWDTYFPLLAITRYMEKLLGKKIDAVVAFEIGGLNSPIVLTLASRLGIPVVDADALGRAAPETHLTSWHGLGVDITPMPLADSEGNIVVVAQAEEPTYVDKVGRWIVTQGGHLGADVQHPMNGAKLKETSIPGTFSRPLELGRALLSARERDVDPVRAVTETLNARHLLQGRIESLKEEEWMGFYFTTVQLTGIGPDSGKTAQLTIKNEAMVFQMDGQPQVIFPDHIYMLDPATGRGYMSVQLRPGLKIHILGAPAHPRLRTAATSEAGRKAFSPVRFGHPNLAYRPMEELMG